MKLFQKLLSVMLLFICLGSCMEKANAQKQPSAKEALIKNLVDSQQYIFYAKSVTPMAGRQRFLTSDYTVYVSKDTVISDLPFFGRAYTAPINTSDAGIKFTTISFDYKVTSRKKGGWDIIIQPKDVSGYHQLNLTVYTNGTAYLNVNSTSRQSISFNGYIAKKR